VSDFYPRATVILNFCLLQGFYEQLKPLANLGPSFQRLRRLSGNENEALAEVATFVKDFGSVCFNSCMTFLLEDLYTSSTGNYCFHPIVLDACLHYVLHPVILQNLELGVTYLPRKLRKFALYQVPKPGEPVYSYFVLRQWTPGKCYRNH
jgi:Polyketide synthase dehydratase